MSASERRKRWDSIKGKGSSVRWGGFGGHSPGQGVRGGRDGKTFNPGSEDGKADNGLTLGGRQSGNLGGIVFQGEQWGGRQPDLFNLNGAWSV